MPDEIEQLLTRQQLRQPSPALDRRIEQALRTAPLVGPANWYRRLSWRQLSMAAAAVLLSVLTLSVATRYLVQHFLPQRSIPVARNYNPNTGPNPQVPKDTPEGTAIAAAPTVTFERIDSELIDQGVVVAEGGSPMRKYRQESVERTWTYDAQTKEMKEATTPHESYVYFPLEVY